MRKLKLDVGELRVDTFATAAPEGPAGTVRGNMSLRYPASDYPCTEPPDSGGGSAYCSGHHTCAETCAIDWCTDVTCNLDLCV